MIHVFRIMPKGNLKLPMHIVTQKRAFRGFFEGLKMAQVGYNWEGTVAPMLIE